MFVVDLMTFRSIWKLKFASNNSMNVACDSFLFTHMQMNLCFLESATFSIKILHDSFLQEPLNSSMELRYLLGFVKLKTLLRELLFAEFWTKLKILWNMSSISEVYSDIVLMPIWYKHIKNLFFFFSYSNYLFSFEKWKVSWMTVIKSMRTYHCYMIKKCSFHNYFSTPRPDA